MVLDPQIKNFLDLVSKLPQPDLSKITPQEFRNLFKQASLMLISSKIEVKNVRDLEISVNGGKIKLRIYEPIKGEKPYPAIVYYHGGGFVLGDLDTYDNVCRLLANSSECLVISVDYRLAPEYKFPVAVYDSYEALKWVYLNANKIDANESKIAVAGDSAGGNLATVVSIVSRDKKEEIVKYQVLIYPVVNMLDLSPSVVEFSEGYFLTFEQMSWFGRQYFKDPKDYLHPYASPLFADLSNLPPALIITAEYDPLRDQGETYANILKSKGNLVTCIRYQGMIHGFINLIDLVETSKVAIYNIAGAIRRHLK